MFKIFTRKRKNKKSIFISHAWRDNTDYDFFVSRLNEILGTENWINTSIPKNDAIRLTGYWFNENDVTSLEDEISRLESKLAQGNLPDVISKTIWDAQGNRIEVETKHCVTEKLRSLYKKIERHKNPLDDKNFGWLRKSSGSLLNHYPELANEIRRRIESSDIVFILIGNMCLFRKWVKFEVELARGTSIPITGVLLGDNYNREIDLFCDKIIKLKSTEIIDIFNKNR